MHFAGTSEGWREAWKHFGDDVRGDAWCQYTALQVRAMEEQLRSYREEDSPRDRYLLKIQSEHATALRHEEERGYLRGLKDYAKVERLLAEAKRMAEFGDINADMEDDGIGWRQWYLEVAALKLEAT